MFNKVGMSVLEKGKVEAELLNKVYKIKLSKNEIKSRYEFLGKMFDSMINSGYTEDTTKERFIDVVTKEILK